jgi:hypothetical protein
MNNVDLSGSLQWLILISSIESSTESGTARAVCTVMILEIHEPCCRCIQLKRLLIKAFNEQPDGIPIDDLE